MVPFLMLVAFRKTRASFFVFDVYGFLRFFQLTEINDEWIIAFRLTIYFRGREKNP
jgi:hypothetical protein